MKEISLNRYRQLWWRRLASTYPISVVLYARVHGVQEISVGVRPRDSRSRWFVDTLWTRIDVINSVRGREKERDRG